MHRGDANGQRDKQTIWEFDQQKLYHNTLPIEAGCDLWPAHSAVSDYGQLIAAMNVGLWRSFKPSPPVPAGFRVKGEQQLFAAL